MDVGKRIKDLREKCHYTQNHLADHAGISQTHLRRVELGQADITVGHLQLVCDALGVSLKDFFDVGCEEEKFSVAISALTPKQKTLLTAFLLSL